jgi:hypothetical protein
MIGPNAAAVAAEMIDVESLGDRPHEQFVEHTVSQTCRPERAVATIRLRRGPFPAVVTDEDLVGEAIEDREVHGVPPERRRFGPHRETLPPAPAAGDDGGSDERHGEHGEEHEEQHQ